MFKWQQDLMDLDPEDDYRLLAESEMSIDVTEYLKGLGVIDPCLPYATADRNQNLLQPYPILDPSNETNNPETIFDLLALDKSRRCKSNLELDQIWKMAPSCFNDKSKDSEMNDVLSQFNIQAAGCVSKIKAKKTRHPSVNGSKNEACSGFSQSRLVLYTTDSNKPIKNQHNKVNERPSSSKLVPVLPGLCLEAVSCPSHLTRSCGKKKHKARRRCASEEVVSTGSRKAAGTNSGSVRGSSSSRAVETHQIRDQPELKAISSSSQSLASCADVVHELNGRSPETSANNTQRTHTVGIRHSGSHHSGATADTYQDGSVNSDRNVIRSGYSITPEVMEGHDPSYVTRYDALRAAADGDVQILEKALDSAPDSDTILYSTDSRGNTALHNAVIGGHLTCVQILTNRCPSLVRVENKGKETPVHLSIQYGQIEILDWFLDNTDIATEQNRGRRPLLNQAAKCGQDGCLRLLLERVPGIQRCTDKYGNTAAHLAAKHGNLTCLQTLVEFGFDVTLKNADGHNPCYYADFANQRQCVGYLLVVESCKAIAERAIQLHQRLKRQERERNRKTTAWYNQDDVMLSTKEDNVNVPPSRVWTLVRHQFKKLERQLLVYRTHACDAESRYIWEHSPSTTSQHKHRMQKRSETDTSGSASAKDDAPSGETDTERRSGQKCRFSPEKIKRLYSGLWALRRSLDRHGARLEDDIFSVKSEQIARTCAKVQPIPRGGQPYLARSSETVATVSPVSSGRAQQRKDGTTACTAGDQTTPESGSTLGDVIIRAEDSTASWCQPPEPGNDTKTGDSPRSGCYSGVTTTNQRNEHSPKTGPAKSVFRSFGWHGLDYHFQKKCGKMRSPCSGNVQACDVVTSKNSANDLRLSSMRPFEFNPSRQPTHHNATRGKSNASSHNAHTALSPVTTKDSRAGPVSANFKSSPLLGSSSKLPSYTNGYKSVLYTKKSRGICSNETSDHSSSDNNNKSEDRTVAAWGHKGQYSTFNRRVDLVQHTGYSGLSEGNGTSCCLSDSGIIRSGENMPLSAELKANPQRPRPLSAENRSRGRDTTTDKMAGSIPEVGDRTSERLPLSRTPFYRKEWADLSQARHGSASPEVRRVSGRRHPTKHRPPNNMSTSDPVMSSQLLNNKRRIHGLQTSYDKIQPSVENAKDYHDKRTLYEPTKPDNNIGATLWQSEIFYQDYGPKPDGYSKMDVTSEKSRGKDRPEDLCASHHEDGREHLTVDSATSIQRSPDQQVQKGQYESGVGEHYTLI